MCEEMFTCQQNLKEHKELAYGLNVFLKSNIWTKMFFENKTIDELHQNISPNPVNYIRRVWKEIT